MGVGPGSTKAFDGRLADPVLETERSAPGRQLVAVLPPDEFNTRQLTVCASRLVNRDLVLRGIRGQRRHRHMHLVSAKWPFPVLGAAVADISQVRGARGHPDLELRGEAV